MKQNVTVKGLLEALEGFRVFSTTRGTTTGDAAGLLLVDDFVIDLYEYADVCPLRELKKINATAYEDCVDFWTNCQEFEGWNEEDFFVIQKEGECLLVWEQE